jgi:hypothetical protein
LNFAPGFTVHITPNPASGFINVSLANNSNAANLQITDLNGRLIKQQTINPGTANTLISLAGVAKGLYSIKLVSAENTSTQKLVVQ